MCIQLSVICLGTAAILGSCGDKAPRDGFVPGDVVRLQVTFQDADLPVLGPRAGPHEEENSEEGPRLACEADAQRTVAWIGFGPWYASTNLRLTLCRDGGRLELAGADLIKAYDAGPSFELLPPATGALFLRPGAAGEIAFAFDVQCGGTGPSLSAHGVVKPEDCSPLEEAYVPLPDCPSR